MPAARPADPVRPILELLSQRWVLFAVHGLLDGPKGFNELGRDCGGASGKVLADKLDALERAGIVERTVLSQIPPRTRYALTPAGRDLRPVLDALTDWAARHLGAPLDWRAVAPGDADHPVRLLQEKWVLLIVRELLRGERGYNELARAVGVNVTTLGQRLARLQQVGLVELEVGSGALPRHTYRLGAAGRALQAVIDEVTAWTERSGRSEGGIDMKKGGVNPSPPAQGG